jgi:hypothetical protein
MKNFALLTLVVLLNLFALNVFAQSTEMAKIALGSAYIPIGFDNINRSQVTVEGVFKDTCYRVGPHRVSRDGNTLTITQSAYVYHGICADVLVPFYQVIELGVMDPGNYNIVDGATGRNLGVLPVVVAPPKSKTTYPDDYLYAPVSDATLLVDSGKHLVISGAFTDDCTHFKEIRVERFNNVIEVLPITERGTNCHRKFLPFQITKNIDIPDGHYLLHVRALSGNAVNKMVDAYVF